MRMSYRILCGSTVLAVCTPLLLLSYVLVRPPRPDQARGERPRSLTVSISHIKGNRTTNTEPTKQLLIMSWTRVSLKAPHRPWWERMPYCVRRRKGGYPCKYVHNVRSMFNISDVVLFNAHTVDVTDMPTWRPPGQIWVFRQRESPVNTRLEVLRYGD